MAATKLLFSVERETCPHYEAKRAFLSFGVHETFQHVVEEIHPCLGLDHKSFKITVSCAEKYSKGGDYWHDMEDMTTSLASVTEFGVKYIKVSCEGMQQNDEMLAEAETFEKDANAFDLLMSGQKCFPEKRKR